MVVLSLLPRIPFYFRLGQLNESVEHWLSCSGPVGCVLEARLSVIVSGCLKLFLDLAVKTGVSGPPELCPGFEGLAYRSVRHRKDSQFFSPRCLFRLEE